MGKRRPEFEQLRQQPPRNPTIGAKIVTRKRRWTLRRREQWRVE